MVLITGIENAKFLCRNVSTSLWKKGSNTSQRGCTLSYLRNKFWSQSLKPVSSGEAGAGYVISVKWLCRSVPLSAHKKDVIRALFRYLCSLDMLVQQKHSGCLRRAVSVQQALGPFCASCTSCFSCCAIATLVP